MTTTSLTRFECGPTGPKLHYETSIEREGGEIETSELGITFEYDLDANRLHVVLPQDDHNVAMNRARRPCWLGPNGKYYCGGAMDTSCECCDGMCGPTKGCNCPDCADMTPALKNRNHVSRSQSDQSSQQPKTFSTPERMTTSPDKYGLDSGYISSHNRHQLWQSPHYDPLYSATPAQNTSRSSVSTTPMRNLVSMQGTPNSSQKVYYLESNIQRTPTLSPAYQEIRVEPEDLDSLTSSTSGIEIFVPHARLNQEIEEVNQSRSKSKSSKLDHFVEVQRSSQQSQQRRGDVSRCTSQRVGEIRLKETRKKVSELDNSYANARF